MHEFSIVTSLIERVEAEALSHNANSVRRVRVRVGELSGIEPELLRTAYELAREGTLCAEAELELDYIRAQWVCSACQHAIDPKLVLRCPACDGPGRLAAGDELDLCSLELEVNDV